MAGAEAPPEPISLATARRIAERIDAATVVSVVAIGDGVKSVVSRVDCEDGERFAVKAYKPEHPLAAEYEQGFFAAVESAPPLPIPRPLLIDRSGDVLPYGFTAMTLLEGEDLLDVVGAMSDTDLTDVYRQIGEIERALHRLPQPGFGKLPLGAARPEYATNFEFFGGLLDAALENFRRLGGSRYLGRELGLYFSSRRDLLAACEQAVLCHCDLHDANVLVVRDGGRWRVSGVLDFESARAGDPLMDLAKTHYAASRGSDQTLAAMIEGYGALPDGWRARFDLYFLYAALDLWLWYAGAGSRAALAGLEREMAGLIGASRTRLSLDRMRGRLRGY